MESYNSRYTMKEAGTTTKDHVVHAGSFFLIEASGDSDEVGLRPTTVVDLADDDAESCIDDGLDHSSCVTQLNNRFEGEEYNNNDRGTTEEEVSICEEPSVCNQKSWVSVESSISEPMTEMEKNKLFWETCLAS
ncbi:hypothetical protein K2173_002984 [Erythroxylum novogranatense]|uniref:Uncharacterized protein n=1 Tax=Erythroxylum novogranatense TaxID=1862640 RepID=A0AAV8S830_9ROSI|nr:hypothetical protein K2173_002984 [Erythroxylum novogranatense]